MPERERDMEPAESKLVYNDGRKVRVLRGIVSFDGPFAVVTRRDGTYRIATHQIIELVQFRDAGESETRGVDDREGSSGIWICAAR